LTSNALAIMEVNLSGTRAVQIHLVVETDVKSRPPAANSPLLSPESDFLDADESVSAVSGQIPHANIHAFRRHARPQSRAKFDDGLPMSQLMPKYIQTGVADANMGNVSSILLPTERQYASPPKTSRGYFTSHDSAEQSIDFNKLYQRTRFDPGFRSHEHPESARAAMLEECVVHGVAPEPVGVLRPIQETFDAEGVSMGAYRASSVAAALRHMPNLETLVLRENRLSGRESAKLFAAVEYGHLQYIDIARNQLHSSAVGLLCRGLSKAAQLQALDVEACKLSTVDAVRLVRCLRRCKQLQRLVLRENKLQDCVAYELLALLVGDDKATLKLDFLAEGRSSRASSSGVELGAVARRSALTPATAIGISPEDDGTGLGLVADSTRWFEALAQNLYLLDLAWNDFSPTGCALIFQALCGTKLSVLDMARNSVGSSVGMVGVDSLCQWLDSNGSLGHMNLANCGLSVLHGKMLSDALQGNVTLRGLHLDGNEVSSDARGYICLRHPGPRVGEQQPSEEETAMDTRRHLHFSDIPSFQGADHGFSEQGSDEPSDKAERPASELEQEATGVLESGVPDPQQAVAAPPRTRYLHVHPSGFVTLPDTLLQHLGECLSEMGSGWWSCSDISVSNTHDMRRIVPRKQRSSRKEWSDQHQEDSSLIKTLSTMRNLSQREKKTIRALEMQRVGLQESMSICWLCGRWRPVTFKYAAPISGPIARRYVLLVASFDDWVPQLLKPSSDGSAYHLNRMVPSRPFYFAFIVDGVMRAGMDYNIAKVEQPRERGKSPVAGIARLLDQLRSADEASQKGFIPPGTEFLNFMPAPGVELAKLTAVTSAKLHAEAASKLAAEQMRSEAAAFDSAVQGQGRGSAQLDAPPRLSPDAVRIGRSIAQVHGAPSTRRLSLMKKMSVGSRRRSIDMFASNWEKLRRNSSTGLIVKHAADTALPPAVRRTKRLSMLNVARAVAFPFQMGGPAGMLRSSMDAAAALSREVTYSDVTSGEQVQFGRRASAGSSSLAQFRSPSSGRQSTLPPAQQGGNNNTVNGVLGTLAQNHMGNTLRQYSGPAIEPRTGGSGDGTAYKAHVQWELSSGVFAGCKPIDTLLIRRCITADMGYIGSRLGNMLKDEAAMAKLRQVFEDNFELLVSVFRRYCLGGAGRGGAKDFFSVSFGGLRQLAVDVGIRDLPGVLGSDVDRMFIAADNKMSTEANNPYKALCRHEFLECLVRLAQLGSRDQRCGMEMVDTFERFVQGPLRSHAMYDRDHLQHDFREKQLWTEASDLAVRQYTQQLQDMHELFKCTKIQRIALASSAKALDGVDIISWLHLLELAGLIDKEHLGISEMDARVAFHFSKGIVVDEQMESSPHRVLSLNELYEALGRLALRVQQVPDFEGVSFVAAFVEVLEFATSIVDESSDAYLHPATIAALRNRTTSMSLHKAGLDASLTQAPDKSQRAAKAAHQFAKARGSSVSKNIGGDLRGTWAVGDDDTFVLPPAVAEPIASDSSHPGANGRTITTAVVAPDPQGSREGSPRPATSPGPLLSDTVEETEESHGHVQSLASLRSAFHAFDADGTGYLSMDEITQLLFGVGQSEGSARRMLETMDANGDGEVSYNEFMATAASML